MGAAALPVALAFSAMGTMAGAMGDAAAQRAQARQERENGRLALKSGEQEAMDVLRQARFEQGAAAAEMAGSGLAFGGSIGTVLAESANQAQLDIDRVRERAAGEANNHYAQARQLKKQARNTIISGVFSTVSNVISGASGMKNQNALAMQRSAEAGTLGSMG